MENVRKGKGIEKRNKQGQATTEFEAEMRENNIPEWFIESCKDFPSIPTGPCVVAYVMMAFRIAWFKVYHPLAFYAAYFSIRAKAFDLRIMTETLKRKWLSSIVLKLLIAPASPKDKDLMSALEVSMEMYQRGYRFVNVDIQHSEARRFSIKDGALIAAILGYWFLRWNSSDAIVAERENVRLHL